jgi:hypothetical protein
LTGEPPEQEAERRRREGQRIAPIIWGALGLLVVAAFVIWLIVGAGVVGRPASPVIAPAEPAAPR